MKVSKIKNPNSINNQIINQMAIMGHEQIVFCTDSKTNLKAIIAIHSTVLGPALGGTRMWNYDSESQALNDVLRLSRGMTLKASISGLNLGGGKAVIIGDLKKIKTDELMKSFGRFVDTLKGSYITAEDVGITTHDMEMVKSETPYVTGIPTHLGGSGDPSPVTAYGVYMGMKASAKYKWGSDNLNGKKIVIQGVGKVGLNLIKYLKQEKSDIYINDLNDDILKETSRKYNVKIIDCNKLYDFEMDIYAPCALGATINDFTIDKLKCKIIAGAANNQLADENRHGQMLFERDILYAPDFLINAGGLINVYSELNGYNQKEALSKTTEIYKTTLEIFNKSELEKITPYQAAMNIAQNRVESNIK
jgi:leucine dehydrogenase